MIVNLNAPTIMVIDGVTLLPGANQVKAAWWAEQKKHKSILRRLEAGMLEEAGSEEESKGLTPEQETELDFGLLGTLTIPGAKSMVQNTTNPKLLEGWMAREKRNQVKGAIKKQLADLTAPVETRDRSQDRQVATGGEPITVEIEAKPSAIDD